MLSVYTSLLKMYAEAVSNFGNGVYSFLIHHSISVPCAATCWSVQFFLFKLAFICRRSLLTHKETDWQILYQCHINKRRVALCLFLDKFWTTSLIRPSNSHRMKVWRFWKRSPGKPGDWDLKLGDFQNMCQMKIICFRVFFTSLVLFAVLFCCFFCILTGQRVAILKFFLRLET